MNPPRSKRFWSGWQTGRHEHGAHGWESRGSSTYLCDDHRCDQKLRTNRSAAVHGHQHGEMTVVRLSSRYGLQGVRVEEASNPGPQSSSHRSLSQESAEDTHLVPSRASTELLDSMQEDLQASI